MPRTASQAERPAAVSRPELLLEVVGPYALPDQIPHDESERWNEPPIGPDWAGPLAPQYFNYRKTSIYGGTNEIQKNISQGDLGFLKNLWRCESFGILQWISR